MYILRRRHRSPHSLFLRICQQVGRGDGESLRRVVMQHLFGWKLQRLRPLSTGRLRIGTRGSKLALWQAGWVKSALDPHLSHPSDIVIIKTRGDKITDVPLAQVGGNALFVKELEDALFDGRIDVAVHSMKDMPSSLPEGLAIGAVPRRESPFDVLVSKGNKSFQDLAMGARVGTSSLRRQAQLLHVRPDLVMDPVRGNLDTRLVKLESQDLDAIVVAAAGMKRLGFGNRITQVFPEDLLLPAVGQGALCIEVREDDLSAAGLVAPLDHPDTRAAVLAERAFLRRLGGSCQVPMAGYAEVVGDRLSLTGLVASLTGQDLVRDTLSGRISAPEEVGTLLAERLLDRGALPLVMEILGNIPCRG